MNTAVDFCFRAPHQHLCGDGEELGLLKASSKCWVSLMTRAVWSCIMIMSKAGLAGPIAQMQNLSLRAGEWLAHGLGSKLVSGWNVIGNQVCLESKARMPFTVLRWLPLVSKVCTHRRVPVEATSHGSRSQVYWAEGKAGREKGKVLWDGS